MSLKIEKYDHFINMESRLVIAIEMQLISTN